MTPHEYLAANSALFWLVLLIAIGIIIIGGRFLFAPLPAARDFGVPSGEVETFTYLRAKGTRDVVSGLLVICLLWLRVSAAVMAAFIFTASLIPFGDMLNVYASAKLKNVPALIIHGGTALFMWILAAALFRR